MKAQNIIMIIIWMIVRVQVKIHNYEFGNYNKIVEGFNDVDEGYGGGDDGDRCRDLTDHSGDGDGSLLRIPSSDPFRRLGFLTVFVTVAVLLVFSKIRRHMVKVLD